MTGSPQSPRDRALWLLANNGGKMERSRLRRCTGMRYADLDPILAELAIEGRINRLSSPKQAKSMISLRADSRTEPGIGQG